MRMQKFYFVAIAILTLALTACGGGGGSSSGSGSGGNPTTAAVEGIWTGTYTINGGATYPISGAITQNGYGFFYETNGVLYVLPALTGSATYSGTLTAYAPPGNTFSNGQSIATFSVTGSVASQAGTATSIQGDFSGSGETGTFTLSPNNPYSGSASVAGLAGQWDGYYLGPGTSITLVIGSNGTFTGNDAVGCNITGTVTQVQPSMNLYQVNLTSTGQAVCAGNLSGLGYESSTDASGDFGGAQGTYAYVGVSNSSSGTVVEIKLQ